MAFNFTANTNLGTVIDHRRSGASVKKQRLKTAGKICTIFAGNLNFRAVKKTGCQANNRSMLESEGWREEGSAFVLAVHTVPCPVSISLGEWFNACSPS